MELHKRRLALATLDQQELTRGVPEMYVSRCGTQMVRGGQ